MVLVSSFPKTFPETWASDWGEDDYGLWMSFTLKGVRQQFRWIPPGEFLMGSPEDEWGRFDDENQHKVILTQGYWLAATACTQALWQEVMGSNPSEFPGADLPVEQVSWKDVSNFIGKLEIRKPGLSLRLPTEAEWEYACRAGTLTPFSFGDDITTDQANFNGNYPYRQTRGQFREKTIPVASIPANDWGLYQMHGNVWEWCSDWYGEYPSGPVVDPQGPKSGMNPVVRGGCWFFYGRDLRSALRNWILAEDGNRDAGFRLASG